MRSLRKHWWVKLLLLGGVGSTLGFVAFGGFLLLSVLALLGGGNVTGTAAGYGAFSYPAVVPKSGGAAPAQEEFAGALVGCSGLDPNVVLAWTLAEGGGVNPSQPPNNFLFLTAATGGFRSFASPEEAAQAVCLTLTSNDYAMIPLSAGQTPTLQLIAIAQSPWDGGHVAWGDPAGHYGGDGRNLLASYYSLIGNSSCPKVGGPC